jgi:pimeloyl-ACP methyl ester carboxylesterase
VKKSSSTELAAVLVLLAPACAGTERADASGWCLTLTDRIPESFREAQEPEPTSDAKVAEAPRSAACPMPPGKSSLVVDAHVEELVPTSTGKRPPDGRLEVGEMLTSIVTPMPIHCFVYKPENWSGERMILVHHGVLRNADEYRDHAIVLGDRFDALIVAPRFDSERFPSRKYQRGGILREDGSAAQDRERTYALVPQIADAIRAREGRPRLSYWIIGHSAGGQFAMRMSAFQHTGAERIVAANPGTDLFPTRDMKFGWGFGGLPEALSDDAQLKRYLAAPLTLYLGTADDHPDEDLDMSPESVKQGPGRYQRGKAAFAMAQQLAREKGWTCNWRLVEAEGVEHDHEKMFAHPSSERALFGD